MKTSTDNDFSPATTDKSKVFFIPAADEANHPAALEKLCREIEFSSMLRKKELVGIKLHFGEPPNPGWIKPPSVKVIADIVKKFEASPFLMETNTLYVGNRSDSVRHILTAYKNGFTYEACGAPVIISDGLRGQSQVEVDVPGAEDRVGIASDVAVTDFIVLLTHVTGHLLTGMGGTLKNAGMGLSSRGGKLKQHSGSHPKVKPDICTECGKCTNWCPGDAISLSPDKNAGKAFINDGLCIGCGQCLSICPFNAVGFDWSLGSQLVQKRIAEHAAGVMLGRKSLCISFLTHMTPSCDCMGTLEEPMCEDIGIAASLDPVALDAATIDIIKNKTGSDIFKKAWENVDSTECIRHAEHIGLGTSQYDLVELKL